MIDCPIDSPCRVCEYRNAECHGTCEVYKQYKLDVENWKKAEKAKRSVAKAIDAYQIASVRRNYVRKWKNKRKKGV